ncbi:MAG: autotransporter outer membrane beta-barrel domain-containing protein [Endomicrobium sp.]|jgi:hypothetical protein|nr:autotransporter outer membrane beta-barrel domain-containing protein [Endomicrobium sp.]
MKKLLFFICTLFLLSAHNCFAGHILIVDKVSGRVINGNSPASESSQASEDPNFNTVLVSTGIISIVNGAQWSSGDVSNNKILLNYGSNVQTVCGGYIVYTGNAYNNEIIINGDAIAGMTSSNLNSPIGIVYGARVSTGNAHNNTVVVENGGIVNFDIRASMVDDGNAIDNTITVNSGGAVKGTIYGGMSRKNGHANTNTVIINARATVNNDVYGGRATNGNANNNSVTIEASNIGNCVNGGFVSNFGYSIGNTVNIRTGTIGADVYGGGATHGNANNNSVTIEASNIGNCVHGGWSNDGDTNDNIVNIRSMSKISQNVYGGWARGNGNANGNLVNLENSNISSHVFCGRVGGNNGGDSNNNTVNIYGTTNAEKVYAAYIHNNGNARNNIINIYGTANTNILCAWVDGNGLATDNKVIIHETGKLGQDFIIFGAKTEEGANNNTLEIHSKDNIAYGVYGFQNYIFFLPSDIKSGDTMFTALNGKGQDRWDVHSSGFFHDNRIDLTSIVKIDIEMSPYTKLNQGDSITILCSNDGFANDLNTDIREIEGQGQTLALNVKHKFTLHKEAHKLNAKLESKKIEIRPEAKSFSKGNIGELVFLNFGSDLIANNGIQEASKVLGLKAFGAFAAGQSKYNIGGTINLNNISSLFGIAKNFKITDASTHIITAAIFCEYGNGNYKIKDIISTGEVRSNGDISYIGAGLLGKLDIGKIEGLYCQGSVRAGKSKNIFNSADIRDTFQNKKASYDYDVPYYSCHIGCGYTYKLAENINLEGYSKYIFTHQNEKKANFSTSEKINFKGLNSNRIGVGVKCKYEGKRDKKSTQKHTKWTTNFYTGIMHEQEFQGNINATTQDSYQLEEINLSGATEVGELGFQINVGRINIDVSGEVFVGKREGISGNVKIKCAIP